jgi:hypothetical protein
MKNSIFICIRHQGTLLIALVILMSCNTQFGNQPTLHALVHIVNSDDTLTIGEAVSYKNLQVFPLYANLPATDPSCISLAEALKNNNAVVKETSSVNQLEIDNLSDEYIFILAGDIVKGGRQDRTMGNDVIIGPREKNVPLESYCVESGRWQQRGEEESEHFSATTKTLASKELKMASRYEKDQSKVWQKVSEEQEKLNNNLRKVKGDNVDVKSTESGSSLQLTLENKELEDYVKEFSDSLGRLNQLPENTIGFAYAINGELYGIELFHDNMLFKNLRQKLFDAIIVEAISENNKDSVYTGISTDSIAVFLSVFSQPSGRTSTINNQTSVSVYETKEAVEFETKLGGANDKWIHRSYLVKSKDQSPENSNYQRMAE